MTGINNVAVPQLAWYGDSEMDLQFPASWQVTACRMRGHDGCGLRAEELEAALAKPLGTRPIADLARGKRDVVILFDDLTRPTQTQPLVSMVLRQLLDAGVPEAGIRFIAAQGAHPPLNRLELEKKLGADVLARFPAYSHNPYENCTYLGKTSLGTPVSINSEVMACDLKIGIGCILPHTLAAFSGGGKIVLPGVASVDTIVANHALQSRPSSEVMGRNDHNDLRQDVDEATRMAGLDFKIDVLVNMKRETAALFAGEPAAARDEGMRLARDFYATELPADADVVVANVYAKVTETGLFVVPAARLLSESGGDLVMLSVTPWGQIAHYLLRSFGKTIGGRRWFVRTTLPPRVERLIVYCPYPDYAGGDWMGPPGSIIWARTWFEVIEELRRGHRNSPRVAVVPDISMQYFV
ncbi:MAG: DUF2088 domain-containing protein [Chloroflexi bacterium]|nr:DUF2088 domain-containing protein [Chloroflexota bacterium]